MRTDGPVQFPETVWSNISRAKIAGTALNEVLKRYRTPVRRYILSQGYSREDAEDLTQEVLLCVWEDKVLSRADRSRGRFRSFLLGVTKNVIREAARRKAAKKRGGNVGMISLDAPVARDHTTPLVADLSAKKTDEDFDRFWLEELVEEAMEKLRKACEKKEQPYYEFLCRYADGGLTYSQLAEKTGRSLENVKTIISRARKRLGDILTEILRHYCSSPEEFEDEIRHFSAYLSGRK